MGYEKKEVKSYGYTVTVTVKEIKGKCEVGHKVGDKIIFDGYEVKGKMCFSAMLHLLPIVHAFAWGAQFPWDKMKT